MELGISAPSEIDVEVVADCVGAEVRFRQLDTCEARIVGYKDRAIITVDRRAYWPRQRFSIAHELGHWRHHRGRSFVCRKEDIGGPMWAGRSRGLGIMEPERVADAYAADLLMPDYLFRPRATRKKRPSFEFVDELRADFQTSRSATAIRLVDTGIYPAILVCHTTKGRAWFRRGPNVPEHWFPREELDPESPSMDVVFGGVARSQPSLVGAEAWFDRRGAEDFNLYEQSVRLPNGSGLALLVLTDPAMLSD